MTTKCWSGTHETGQGGPARMCAAGTGAFVAISRIGAGQPRLPSPPDQARLALQGFVKLLADRYGPEGLRFKVLAPDLMESAGR